jgi:hypothetical protein
VGGTVTSYRPSFQGAIFIGRAWGLVRMGFEQALGLISDYALILGSCRSFRHLKFTFLSPQTSIKIAAKLYPVHSFGGGIQAKDMFIGLTDVLYSTNFVLADSSHTVFKFEGHMSLLAAIFPVTQVYTHVR